MTKTSQFKVSKFQQSGDFQTKTASGTIQTMNNLDKSSIETADNLTISHLTIGKSSHFEASGSMTSSQLDNQGVLAWKGGKYHAGTFKGSEEAVLHLENDFRVEGDQFDNQGWVEAQEGLCMHANVPNQKFGKLRVVGKAVYTGKAAFDSLSHTDFTQSTVSEVIKVHTPQDDLVIKKPVDVPFPLEIEAKNVVQDADVKAQTLNVKAERIEIKKSLDAVDI